MRVRQFLFCFATLVYFGLSSQSLDRFTEEYIRANFAKAQAELDTLIQKARSGNDFEAELKLLEKRLYIASADFQNEMGLTFSSRSIELAKKMQMLKDFSTLYNKKALYLARLGRVEETIAALDSVFLFIENANAEEQGKILLLSYYLQGRMYDRSGKFEEATKAYLKTIDQAIVENDSYRIMDSYMQLGFVSKALNNLPTAMEYYQKSLEYAINSSDTTFMVYNLTLMAGDVVKNLDEDLTSGERRSILDTAYSRLQRASKLAAGRNIPTELAFLYSELASYFLVVEQYEKALDYIFRSRKQSQRLNDKETEMSTYSLAARCYLGLEMFKKAIEQSEQGIVFANEIGSYYYFAEFYDMIVQAADNLGDLPKAYRYQSKLLDVKDSIYKAETTEAVSELQTKYETEKKEAEIATLKQDAEIQSLKIEQRNLAIIFGLIAFVLVVLTIIFLNRQINAAKRRKQIELEQRFLRSQLNPHFISNALVSVQSSMMEGNVEEAESYLATFSRLMREILEYSREEAIPFEDELAMLRDYLEINKKRLKGTFDYSINVDERIEGEFDKVPPMIVQPFLENSIEHGNPPGGERLNIDLRFEKREEHIYITITDNGGGIVESPLNGRKSLSTQIINERITLLNESLKKGIRLTSENWSSNDVRGLKVTLSLPLV